MINVIRKPNPDDDCYRAVVDPFFRVWRLSTPHSNFQRYFRNVTECEEYARKQSPTGTLLVCDAVGICDRTIRWDGDQRSEESAAKEMIHASLKGRN